MLPILFDILQCTMHNSVFFFISCAKNRRVRATIPYLYRNCSTDRWLLHGHVEILYIGGLPHLSLFKLMTLFYLLVQSKFSGAIIHMFVHIDENRLIFTPTLFNYDFCSLTYEACLGINPTGPINTNCDVL